MLAQKAADRRSGQMPWTASAAPARRDGYTDDAASLHRAIEDVPHALLILAENGEVLGANRLAELAFAAHPGALTNVPIEQLAPEVARTLRGKEAAAFRSPGQVVTLGLDHPVAGARCDGALVPLEVALRMTASGSTRHIVAAITPVADKVRMKDALQQALDERSHTRKLAAVDNGEIRPNASVLRATRLIVADSPVGRQALAQVEQVAATPATVLLLGETGAGKELFAQAIHDLSPRHQQPMIRVSCAAIPSTLIESELFGRERGAYTDAITRQIGRFEAANRSTLFLDEIGELPAEVQVKLLRVLQERVIERLGSTQSVKVDVRIIAATNRNLAKAVEDKTFREDLFYRLHVFPIVVPPLRERVEDIPGLVWQFIDEFSKSFGKSIESISQASMRQLQLYPWPGNVRELRNVIERAVIIATGPRLTVNLPQLTPSRQPLASMTLRNLEREHISATLESTKWRIRGVGGAAERLGLKPTTLEGRMAKLGLVRPIRP